MRHSFIIVDRSTGQAVMETFSAETASKINRQRYEVVTAYDWLCRLNGQIKAAQGGAK